MKVTDELVLEKVFDGEYETWGDFKKEMFYECIDKQDALKPIIIQYELGKANSMKEVAITSAEEMQELINEVVEKDITNIDRATSRAPVSWVHLLKQKSIMHIFVLQMTSKSLYIIDYRNEKKKSTK